jgi:Tol biopolymer transport system component
MLTSGSRLGGYEILSLLGTGGMGEVYRAKDLRLNRQVALKVLPQAVACDSERLGRFEREAQVLAALNHPNIAAIYGVEDSGGTPALVMELVDGETLADRIGKGAIPVEEVLPIAKQIAEALQAAHEQEIVHRDLKPANIKVREDGTVKVLDFGLAKAMEPVASTASSAAVTNSPTITSPALMTGVGVLLGTAAYMSPEQAKGRSADKRSDIWAFGCVLYEMLTGRRAFAGDDVSDTLAAVLRGEPSWHAIPDVVPPYVTRLVKHCLVKDRTARIPDLSVVGFLLDDGASAPAVPTPAAVRYRGGWIGWAAAAILLVTTIVLGTLYRRSPDDARAYRFNVLPPDGWSLPGAPTDFVTPFPLAVSADGRRLALVFRDPDGHDRLWIRTLDTLDAQELRGTDGARSPFWSPDGRSIGFFADGKLKRIDIAGGPAITLCASESFAGGSWNRDGVIIFAAGVSGSGLKKVLASAPGAPAVAATELENNDTGHIRPSFLPDGRHFIYRVTNGRSYVGALDSSDRTALLDNGVAVNVLYAQGHLLFLRDQTLMAQPFDLSRLSTTGVPMPIAEEVETVGSPRLGMFSASASGVLVYQRSVATGGTNDLRRVIWMDREGKRLGAVTDHPLQFPRYPRLSPDGHRLALTVGPRNEGQIWIYDLANASQPLKLTVKSHNTGPIWTRDGKHITFASSDRETERIVQLPSDASSLEPEAVGTTNTNTIAESPQDWSPDGLLFVQLAQNRRRELWLLPLTGDRKPRPWLQTGFDENEGTFSPSGRWVAYVTDQTGQPEVWVRPFPGPGSPRRVSSTGGHDPVWSRDGRELFYQNGAKLMSVEVGVQEPELQVKPPRMLFEGGFVPYVLGTARTYDVDSTGRFLMIEPNEPSPTASLVLITNWFEELKTRVSAK